jgi:uncharacterized protein YggT (Ycf19 family)
MTFLIMFEVLQYFIYKYNIYIYVCVCVCVVRKEHNRKSIKKNISVVTKKVSDLIRFADLNL